MSSENQPENPPVPPAPALASPAAPGPMSDDLLQKQPGIATVMCPMGFTPYAIEGLTLSQPLFARVTYRPL